MYTLVKAVLKERGINQVWAEVDIANMTVPDIFKKYHSGYLALKSVVMDHIQYVDLQALKATKIPMNTQPFTQWLQTLGNTKLPATETEPKFSSGIIVYADAWQVGYHVERADPQTGLPNPVRVETDLTDALLTKPSVAPTKFVDALVTINGFLHRCAATKAGLLVKEAGSTLDLSMKNHVGIISFAKLAPMEIVGIKPEQIQAANPDVPIYKSCFINLGRDLTNKSIIMSLGGFFNMAGIEVVNPTTGIIKLTLTRAQIHKRLLESLGKINLKPLDLFIPENTPKSIPAAQAIDDVTIRKYLTLSQTFFVVVDTPALSVNRLMLDRVPRSGLYESKREPRLPMITSLGLLPEYNKVKQGNFWLLRAGQLYSKDFNYETGSVERIDRMPPQALPTKGHHKEVGHLLEIRSMQIITP